MSSTRSLALACAALLLAAHGSIASPQSGDDCLPAVLSLSPTPPLLPGETVYITVTGLPGSTVLLGADLLPGPAYIHQFGGLTLNLRLSRTFRGRTIVLPASGTVTIPCTVMCGSEIFGIKVYMQGISFTHVNPKYACVTNAVELLWEGDCCDDLRIQDAPVRRSS